MTPEMKPFTVMFMICLLLPIVSAEALRHELRLRTKRVLPISLGMNDQSIDDMYIGCTKEMAKKFDNKYFFREIKKYSFKNALESAKTCVKMAKKRRKFLDMFELNNNQLYAICLYTIEEPQIYQDFNTKVRTSAQQYNSQSFKYHALHFWLTSAIQTLRKKSKNKEKCLQTFRRTQAKFTGVMNQIIRFGSFASTSYKKDLVHFGTETCFSITTCLGAYLKKYSAFADEEEEVLIPPYEKFEITDIKTAPYNGIQQCNTIYVLNSVGFHSELNCKAV